MRRLKFVGMILVLAALYFEAGHLGLKLASVHTNAPAFWPPTGIAVAVLLVAGARLWPGVFLGAFLVNATTPGTFWTSLGLASGNTIEALVGAALVSRFAGGRDFPFNPRAVLRFVLYAGIVAATASTTIGLLILTMNGYADPAGFRTIWLHWWLGNVAGALLVAPPLVTWCADPKPGWTPRQKVEAALILFSILGFAHLVFGRLTCSPAAQYPTAFLVMPLLLWPAFRFGPRETATATFALALLALTGTLGGSGPFAGSTPSATVLSLQTFIGVVAVTGMVIAATNAERKRATAALDRSRKELEALNEQLVAACVSDPLTGIANRRGLEVRLAEEVARSKRLGTPLAVMIVDVDRFRRHNQELGHGGADAVLKTIAGHLREEIRETDYLARFGGDEFVVLLPNTEIPGARVIADRCRMRVAAHAWNGRSVTVSIGIGAVRTATTGSSDLLSDADKALFRAKGAGRNRIAHSTGGRVRVGAGFAPVEQV